MFVSVFKRLGQGVRPATVGIALFIPFVVTAATESVTTCTNVANSATRKIFSTFTAPGAAPCKISYETPIGLKIAADAKFDVNKCLNIESRLKSNLERSGWHCNGTDNAAAPVATPSPATPLAAVPHATNPTPAGLPQQADDRTAVRQSMQGPWTEECLYSYPGKWKRNAELSDGEIDVYPGPGDPLARHNFVYSVGNARFTYIDRVFIAGKSMPWEEAQTYAPTMKRQDFDAAVSLRANHAGQFIDQHILDGLAGGSDSGFEKRGVLELQGRYSSDGRFKTTTETTDIIFQDQLLIASIVFLPIVNREPSITEEPTGFTFSCSALSTMDVEAFRYLCKSLIEKATLNERSTAGACEYSSEGRLEFSKR